MSPLYDAEAALSACGVISEEERLTSIKREPFYLPAALACRIDTMHCH